MSDFRRELYRILPDFDGSPKCAEAIANRIEALHQRHSVPDEPTQKMLSAGAIAWRGDDSMSLAEDINWVYKIYKAMIAAAKENSDANQS